MTPKEEARRQRISNSAKANYRADPSRAVRTAAAIRRRYESDPSAGAKMSASQRMSWADPQIRVNRERALRDPDVRARISASLKGRRRETPTQGDPGLQRRARRYGMAESDIWDISSAQSGLCGICSERPWTVLDHDHSTGLFRGLLCHRCNEGLGCFDDDPLRLLGAQEYLKQYRIQGAG